MKSTTTDINNCPLCFDNNYISMYESFNNAIYVKCRNCTLVYQNPRAKIQYEIDYWSNMEDPDGLKRDLMSDKERKFKVKNRFSNELNYINNLSGGNILDAGCGPGFFLAELNDKWNKYGIELSKYNIEFIKNNIENVDATVGMIENMPYEDNFFDVIYCFQVMEHVYNPVDIIKEFKRVCKPHGMIIISTPNIESFCAKRFKGNYRLLGAPHTIMWSKKTLKKLFKIINYDVYKEYYPYFETDYFTIKNILKLFNKNKISPPFYGNEMNLYAKYKTNK